MESYVADTVNQEEMPNTTGEAPAPGHASAGGSQPSPTYPAAGPPSIANAPVEQIPVSPKDPEPHASRPANANPTVDTGGTTYCQSFAKVMETSSLDYMIYAQSRDIRATTVSMIDVLKSGQVLVSKAFKIGKGFTAETLKNVGADVWYRIVMVEDLSSRAIDILGREFQLDPDLIVEYLALQCPHLTFSSERLHEAAFAPSSGSQYEPPTGFRPILQNRPHSSQHNTYIGPPQVFIPRQKNYMSIQWSRVFAHLETSTVTGSLNILRPFSYIGVVDTATSARPFPRTPRLAAHYEGASISWSKNNNGSFTVLLLLDPLPSQKTQFRRPNTIFSYDHCRGKWDSTPGRNTLEPLRAGDMLRPNPNSDAFYPLPREKRSTRQTLINSLPSHMPDMPTGTMDHAPPNYIVIVLLFQIIERDSYVLLATIAHSLQDIHTEMHVKEIIQQRLQSWQDLFAVYRAHVISTRCCISNLITNLDTLSLSTMNTDPSLQSFTRHAGHRSQIIYEGSKSLAATKYPVYRQLLSLLEQVESVYLEIHEISSILMSTMSIIESKKAIEEAEGITRLTELAFFFIPLAFSASIFGMQVKEFIDNRVSIYHWIITAICIVLGSYFLRLVIAKKQRIMDRVKRWKVYHPGYQF